MLGAASSVGGSDLKHRSGTPSLCQEAMLIRQEWRQREAIAESSFAVPICFAVASPVNIRAIAAAWQSVLRRHSLLRTTFSPTTRYCEGDRVRQLITFRRTGTFVPGLFRADIWGEPEVAVRQTRIDTRSVEDSIAAIEELANRTADTPATGDCPVVTLVSTASDLHFVLGTLSHLTADGWSFRLLQREYVLYYSLLAGGGALNIVEAASFDDFARAETKWALSQDASAHVRHWREQWDIAATHRVEYSRLPFAARIWDGKQPAIGTLRIALPDATAHVLRAYLATTGYSAHAVLRTAFMLALADRCGADGVSCWTNFANRRAPGAREIVGLVSTRYPLGFRVMPQTFDRACRFTNAQLVAGRTHEALPIQAFLLRTGLRTAESDARITFDSSWPASQSPNIDDVRARPVPLWASRHWIDVDVRFRYEGGTYVITASYKRSRYDEAGLKHVLDITQAVAAIGTTTPSIDVRTCVDIARGRCTLRDPGPERRDATSHRLSRIV